MKDPNIQWASQYQQNPTHLIKAMVIIGIYVQRNHVLTHLTTENEINLRSMEHQLRTPKLFLSTTPDGLHEMKVERSIQTIKRRLGATKAALSYILPVLEAEAYKETVIRLRNIIPTTNTGTKTPHEIFHNEKPKLHAYSCGTIALSCHPRSEETTIRAEIEIFQSHGYNLRHIKVWIPHRHQIYSMRHIKPLKYQLTPPSWNYSHNKRVTLPIQDGD